MADALGSDKLPLALIMGTDWDTECTCVAKTVISDNSSSFYKEQFHGIYRTTWKQL
jgi:hypothetical protein